MDCGFQMATQSMQHVVCVFFALHYINWCALRTEASARHGGVADFLSLSLIFSLTKWMNGLLQGRIMNLHVMNVVFFRLANRLHIIKHYDSSWVLRMYKSATTNNTETAMSCGPVPIVHCDTAVNRLRPKSINPIYFYLILLQARMVVMVELGFVQT